MFESGYSSKINIMLIAVYLSYSYIHRVERTLVSVSTQINIYVKRKFNPMTGY